ncbi:BF3164 family lipoprotein [Algoriphagus sp. D3-2-R+10]|uniref:BF3164 family lipoprotein n=1 Tax=Algoriphagus aurantiacus TaxID=3103948 RepID=UPI002B36935F|nr:BF3164 family lipoprotein [Algoriphagus sp. D3-2-R+10]MEB2774019.1 BF3164 family lipoprotein [Algoriphagus sp. D3-2-R+10]
MNRFILVLLLFALVSCENDSEQGKYRTITKEDFKEISITSEKHFFEEVINPSSIGLAQGKLLISEAWRVPEEFPRMHLINSSNWTYDKPKGKHGQGPFEITDAEVLYSPDADSFWIYNMNRRKLAKFSIQESSLLATEDWKFPEPMMDLWFLEFGPNGNYLGVPRESEYKIQEFDSKGNLVANYGEFEILEERPDLTKLQISLLMTGWFKGDPKRGLYVRACLRTDLLEIFNYKTKEFISITGPDSTLPEFQYSESKFGGAMVFDRNVTYRYRDIAFTEDYIFALYAGHGQLDYNETGIMAEQIWVFDHNGKPLWNLTLDRSIIQIVINDETNEIYGLTTDEDPGIAVFAIPEELMD